MTSELKKAPAKLYYRIGEVAKLVGVETHVLRYWETEFRAIRPRKSSSGQRIYSHKDVSKLLQIKDLLYTQGYTIVGARKRLRQPAAEFEFGAERPPADSIRVEIIEPLEDDEPAPERVVPKRRQGISVQQLSGAQNAGPASVQSIAQAAPPPVDVTWLVEGLKALRGDVAAMMDRISA